MRHWKKKAEMGKSSEYHVNLEEELFLVLVAYPASLY